MRLRLFLALLVSFAFAACGDARLSSSSEGDDNRPGNRPGVDAGPDAPAADVVDDGSETPLPDVAPDDATCVLIPSVGGDPFVGVGSAIPIGVYQYDLATGTVMTDQRVSFTVTDGIVDVFLSSENVRTNEDGLAQVRLNAGDAPGQATIRVQSECSAPIDITVDVLELPTGNLTVRFNYPFRETYDVAPVRTRLFLADELRCSDVSRGEAPPGELIEVEAPFVTSSASFPSLQVDQEYTLVVLGVGERGEVAAHGCADAVFVREGRTTETTVDLFLLPLNPAGDYDGLSYWDFRDALTESGEVGAIIVQVLDIFEDPGRGLYDFILDLVEVYVGGIISVVIDVFLDITGLDDLIAGAINDLIDSSPFLSDIVTIGRDLRSIVAELEVISELDIGKLGSDFELFGVDEWIGLSLYWRLGCEPTDPPDCGRIPIILDTADLGLLRGEWTGRVIGYDRLDIDRHPIDFEYGRLILFVLENLVLPAITGDPAPVTLEDLMESIIGCEALGNAIIGDGNCLCAFGACICDTDVEDFCGDFISFAFGGLFRGFVEALSFDAVLDIRGSVTLENLDDNLAVDGLRNGEYIGNINIGGAPTPFTASFCAVNINSGLDVVAYCAETSE